MKANRTTCFLLQEAYDRIREQYARFNEPWKEEETEEMKVQFAGGQPLDAIAQRLQRTPNSIRMRLKSLGLIVSQPAAKPWTQEDEELLIDLYEDGEPFEDIAEYFGRSVNAIVARLVRLRVRLFSSQKNESVPETDKAMPTGL